MKKIIFATMMLLLMAAAFAQPEQPPNAIVVPATLKNQHLVERFYQVKGQPLFWFESNAAHLRERFRLLLDNAGYLALDKSRYHYEWIKENVYFDAPDSSYTIAADKVYTDAAISFCKDLYQGYDIDKQLNYDELSAAYEAADNSYILMGLSSVTSANELEWFVSFLEPADKDYIHLKRELRKRIDSCYQPQAKQLTQSINLLRWIRHFNFSEYVVVNPASAIVRYYVDDTVNLRMKAVVGTQSTPTPRFAGYCNEVVLYPYWHVPYSIAVNEILPAVKKNRSYLAARNMQVIDAKGKIIDPATLNWGDYSPKNFPYQFRQSNGCDNALGLIKFNLTDPFSVYMHDTNNKTGFMAGSRYFSHGCIRLEKPVELASAFLPGQINAELLEACATNQKPVALKLPDPVPVFVIYTTCEYDDDGAVRYYKDVYKLLQ